jgi:PHO85 cyclin-5
LKPTIPSVPEDFEESCLTASPESYTGPVGKDFCDMSLETPLARRQREMNDAARALQELQRQGSNQFVAVPAKTSLKRSRTASIDSLQENVREMLAGRYMNGEPMWSDTLVRARADLTGHSQQVPVRATAQGSRKRVCCSTEAAESFMISSLHPHMGGLGGPGMWNGILD